jgi:hypothetical protein
LRLASRLAGPRAIIWYTVDYDAQKVDLPAIRNAFVALKDALNGEYRVGAYASGYVCEELFKDGLIAARWITDSVGFRGSREAIAAGRYEMRQWLPAQIAGLDTDPDPEHVDVDGKVPDIGAFVPFGAARSSPRRRRLRRRSRRPGLRCIPQRRSPRRRLSSRRTTSRTAAKADGALGTVCPRRPRLLRADAAGAARQWRRGDPDARRHADPGAVLLCGGHRGADLRPLRRNPKLLGGFSMSDGTVANLAPLVSALAQLGFVVAAAIAAAFVQKHVKDQAARRTILQAAWRRAWDYVVPSCYVGTNYQQTNRSFVLVTTTTTTRSDRPLPPSAWATIKVSGLHAREHESRRQNAGAALAREGLVHELEKDVVA